MRTRLKMLRQKAGPVLFQLPAGFEADRERLAHFLGMLPKKYRYAFEFRHESWYRPDILELLEDHDNYSDETMRAWADDIRRWQRQHRQVFVYFDNDQKSAAPKDARRLVCLLADLQRQSKPAHAKQRIGPARL